MRASAAALAALLAFPAPASACLTCGCSGSGISGDVAGGGASSFLFSNCATFIVQQGLSFRSVTGSFTETGAWNPTPTDGSLSTVQGTVGLMWFPTPAASLSLNLPLIGNSLQKATWGPLGSVAPTEIGATGAGLGDIQGQASLKLLDLEEGGLAGWAGATIPSGASTGDPASLTGAGVVNAQGGLIASYRHDYWTFTGTLGMQRPVTSPPLTGTTFYIGNAVLWQAQVAHTFNPGVSNTWSLGLGAQGFRGEGRFGPNDVPFQTGKVRLVPAFQYDFDLLHGFRFTAGWDPATLGTNAMTDVTIMTTFYQGYML